MGIKKQIVSKSYNLLDQFPIRDNVNCFLSGIRYKEYSGSTIIEISFKRDNIYLNHSIFQPKKDDVDYEKKLLNFRKCVESLVSLFLPGKDMLDIYKTSTSLGDYINKVEIKLKEKKYWTVELEIKTLVNREMKVILPMYPDYIKLKDSFDRDISYTKWEKDNNKKNLYYN